MMVRQRVLLKESFCHLDKYSCSGDISIHIMMRNGIPTVDAKYHPFCTYYKGESPMKDPWKEKIMCMIQCPRCGSSLKAEDERILSVYDHEPVCMKCKGEEEKRPDYADVSKMMIGQCLIDTEMAYSDPGGYCYHHFYPYKC